MTKFILSFIFLSDTILQCCYITEGYNKVKIDPDKLRNGLDYYASSSNKAELYEFLARYVRKVLVHMYLEGIFCIPRGMPHRPPTWPFPWSLSVA